jgi:hypothetical protein
VLFLTFIWWKDKKKQQIKHLLQMHDYYFKSLSVTPHSSAVTCVCNIQTKRKSPQLVKRNLSMIKIVTSQYKLSQVTALQRLLCNRSNTTKSVSSDIQTPRRSQVFLTDFKCLDIRWNTLSRVWYSFSIH